MSETREKSNFMSIMLTIFTGVVSVMVLFALASSASMLAQVIAFILALVAFLFCIVMAIYFLNRQNNETA